MSELTITIYDLDDKMTQEYEKICIFGEATNGSYVELTGVSTRIELKVDTEYYYYTVDDDTYTKFKYKLLKEDGTTFSDFITDFFYGDTSDLTEKLRYMIEDITNPKRYTVKELRRFINIAINRLQGTSYRRRFKADFDGIIHPKMDRIDEAIILLQSLIILNQSQLTRAADTNMSFKDGRGTVNIRTTDTLKDNIKDWKEELKMMVNDVNRMYISPTIANMLYTSPYYNQYCSAKGV